MTVPCSTRRLGSPHLPRDDLRGTCNAESGHLAMRCLILFDSSWAMNYTHNFTKRFIEDRLHLGSAAFLPAFGAPRP